jgi:thiamine pyrophosphokinase
MKEKIVQTALGITIIGAGRVSSKQIGKSLSLAPFVVAADGGAKVALKEGVSPDAVIGDFDGEFNGGEDWRRSHPAARVHRIDEQVSTDFEKCLYSMDAPFAIAHGVTGSRFDHSLAAMNALAKHHAFPVFILSGKDVIFLCPPELTLDLPIGTRLSLFPLAKVQGRAEGLEYPIDGLTFSPLGRIGTSNRTIAKSVPLEFDAPHMLVILPWKHLKCVLNAFGLSNKSD